MENIKQQNIRNKTYYFHDDLINLKDFDPSQIKIDKKSYKHIGIYNNGYVTKKPEYNIKSVNPFYLLFW